MSCLQNLINLINFLLLLISFQNSLISAKSPDFSDDVSLWLKKQIPLCFEQMLDHVHPNGAIPAGAGIHYPYQAPDHYTYHWVRDSGITMMILAKEYEETQNSTIAEKFKLFLSWAQVLQQSGRNDGGKMAWTRFNMTTGEIDKNWNSPQYDGLGYRSIAFMTYSKASGLEKDYFDANDENSVIKSDLDAICRYWNESDGFEPWEDVQGQHFEGRMIHLAALDQGTIYAKEFADIDGSSKYAATAQLIRNSLESFWNGRWIVATLNGHMNPGGNDGSYAKVQNGLYIDVSTIMGLNFNQNSTPKLSVSSPYAQATFSAMIDAFKNGAYRPKIVLSTWSLNKITCSPDGLPLNPAIGRFPEDIYDGYGYKYSGSAKSYGAGFWFMDTNNFAEFLYNNVVQYMEKGVIEITADNLEFWRFIGLNDANEMVINENEDHEKFQHALKLLFINGDNFLRRVMQSVPESGYMSEQFHYATGSQLSIPDISWNYATTVKAYKARNLALKMLGRAPKPHVCQPVPAGPLCPLPGFLKKYKFYPNRNFIFI